MIVNGSDTNNPYFVLKHIIIDFIGCTVGFDSLNSPEFLRRIAEDSIRHFNGRIVSYTEFRFEPYGYTFVAVLAGSSFSLHSWPEESFVSVDIFTCTAESNPERAIDFIGDRLKPSEVHIHRIERPYLK